MDRLDGQTARREANALYLARELAEVPGVRPLARRDYVTRHAYHLFIARYDAEVYGVPREAILKALQAEGVPFWEGYTMPLYRQPMYRDRRFGPFTGYRESRPDLDYAKCLCPVTERACAEAAWLVHSFLLGPREDMDDIVRACRKVYEHREELARHWRATHR
jgi:dTDP-4-amino-4,6-dideoxygalactose transaminase